MRKLDSFTGEGTISSRRFEPFPCTYTVEVWHDSARNRREASGTVRGSVNDLFSAFDSDDARLTMSNGWVLEIVLGKTSGDGTAEIFVNSRIPGY
ncbi:hypothetical protein [Enterovirga aerilata]|uniref:Uncharacterized protein n=1 Tax=Enterovirga aerilata TaxID=2730920 RepID=A0A849I502_9HYPH|nr:hypothetical protein [Enterovirga sp. DB1703]NNM71415.1 hypothetical protein [Enterovirga sp. DB1703]